jgi:hypothetical protein
MIKKSALHFSNILLVPFFLMALTSCGKVEEGDLDISLGADTAAALPAGAVSCNAKFTATSGTTPATDVQANTFSIGKVTLSWKNTADTVTIISAQVILNHVNLAGGKYDKCLIAGDELNALFSPAFTSKQYWTGIIPAATSTTPIQTVVNDSHCALTCGGLKAVDPSKPFTAYGTIVVTGIQTNAEGESKPVRASTPVKVMATILQ